MTYLTHLSWLPVALPAAGALILLIAGRRSDRWGHLFGCATVLASFGIGLVMLADMLGRDGPDRAIHPVLFNCAGRGTEGRIRDPDRSIVDLFLSC